MEQYQFFSIRTKLYWHSIKHNLRRMKFFGRKKILRMSAMPIGTASSLSALSRSLLSYKVPQFNAASCSVASAAIVLNAARDVIHKDLALDTITQEDILEKITWANWKMRVSPNGYQGRRGLPVEILYQVMGRSLIFYGIPHKRLEMIKLSPQLPNLNALKEQFLDRLLQFENGKKYFFLAHFAQGYAIGGMHIPHISPIGAFNATENRVLVIDVDPDQKEPYWVDFDLFFNALSSDYNGVLSHYGYTGGGYVWFTL